MDLTYIVTGALALVGLVACLIILPYVLKPLSERIRENVIIGVYVLLISYVAAYYIIRPLSVLFGNYVTVSSF
jgi:Ca2+-dependent lipid-binding protein